MLGAALAAMAPMGCSSSASIPADTVMASPGPPPREAGCVTLDRVLSPDQCRGDWACSDAAVLTVACLRTDASWSCACVTGEGEQDDSSGPAVAVAIDPCVEGGLETTAAIACGRNVP